MNVVQEQDTGKKSIDFSLFKPVGTLLKPKTPVEWFADNAEHRVFIIEDL